MEAARIHGLMEKLNAKNPFRGKAVQAVPTAQEFRAANGNAGKFNSSLAQQTVAAATPLSSSSSSSRAHLDHVQDVLNHLQYNFLPSTFFCLQKSRPLHRIVATAKEILQESLPIRCLEATFVGLYLTCASKDVERFPVAFKSKAGGKSYRHIVLFVKHRGLYGAIGLSRSELLMNKPVTYRSINDLMEEFFQCYRKVGHQLHSLKIGLYLSHDPYSKIEPCWRFVSLTLQQPLQSFLDCLRTTMILEHLELLHAVVSDQYLKQKELGVGIDGLMLASPTISGQPKPQSLISATTQQGDDDDEGETSDCEENQRRISCLIAMRSPFASSSAASQLLGPGRNDNDDRKFGSRLRRAIHDNPSTPGAAVESTVLQHQQQPRSRTVPPRRRPPVNDAVALPARRVEAPVAANTVTAPSSIDSLCATPPCQPSPTDCYRAELRRFSLDSRDEPPISLSRLECSIPNTPLDLYLPLESDVPAAGTGSVRVTPSTAGSVLESSRATVGRSSSVAPSRPPLGALGRTRSQDPAPLARRRSTACLPSTEVEDISSLL